MSDIKTSNSVTITNAKIQAIARRVSNTFELAAMKAVASQANPTGYPLPADPNSIERLFLKRFQRLPKDRQQSAISKVMATVTAPASSGGTIGDLAAVKLQSATSVLDQVRQLKFPPELSLSASDLATLSGSSKSEPIASSTASAPPTRLELRIRKVKCIDDTSESGKTDEISLGGSIIDASGKTSKVSAFKVGDFQSGDVKEYSSKVFGQYDLTKSGPWPRCFIALLVLCEDDWGGFADYLDALLDAVEEEVTAAMTAALVGSFIGSAGGPVGSAVGALISVAVVALFGWLKSVWNDDPFTGITVSALMDSQKDDFSGKTVSSDYVAKFKEYGGSYEVTYYWQTAA